eukprot:gene23139-30343_t
MRGFALLGPSRSANRKTQKIFRGEVGMLDEVEGKLAIQALGDDDTLFFLHAAKTLLKDYDHNTIHAITDRIDGARCVPCSFDRNNPPTGDLRAVGPPRTKPLDASIQITNACPYCKSSMESPEWLAAGWSGTAWYGRAGLILSKAAMDHLTAEKDQLLNCLLNNKNSAAVTLLEAMTEFTSDQSIIKDANSVSRERHRRALHEEAVPAGRKHANRTFGWMVALEIGMRVSLYHCTAPCPTCGLTRDGTITLSLLYTLPHPSGLTGDGTITLSLLYTLPHPSGLTGDGTITLSLSYTLPHPSGLTGDGTCSVVIVIL